MEAAAHILVAVAPMTLACLWPFIRTVRGRQVFGSFLLCWVSIVFSFLLFSTIIPLTVSWINHSAGENLFLYWLPEPPIVMAMTFFGWFYAGVTILLGILVRDLVCRFFRPT